MKSKKRKQHQPSRSIRKSIIKIAIYCMIGIMSLPVVLLFSIKTGIIGKLPDKEQLSDIRNFDASEIYSADGKLLGRYFIQNRTVLEYEQISHHLIDALVATEDARFFEHHGVDFKSLIRVFFKTLIMGDRGGGGGSTITQQLVKNIYPRQEYPFFSIIIVKLREMLIATELEDIYTKDEILTLYLNTVPFGENLFGVDAASMRFFQKSAGKVNIQEAAMLIGMLKATTYYNPKNYPERALGRRNVVLGQMAKAGLIHDKELDSLKAFPVKLNYKKTDQNDGIATYFREHVRQTLNKLIPQIADSLGESYNLYTDGLKIYTTLDSRLQTYAEKAVYRHMRTLQKTFDQHWKGREKPWENDDNLMELVLKQSPAYKHLTSIGISKDSINTPIHQKKEMEVYSWSGKETKLLSTMDSIRFYLRYLNTGFLSVDPSTGQIKAWVGGINHRFSKYDHVNKNSKRQVGSIFKPIVYASALEQNISPCNYIKAEQETYTEKDKDWKPSNADNDYEGKYSLEGALTESVNTVSVKVLEKAGIDKTISLAKDMGIDSDIPNVPSIALGTPSISLIEMVEAYCVFVNKGKRVQPYIITRIENKEGKVIWKNTAPRSEQVLSLATSQMMIEMLKNVVNSGTAIRLRSTYKLPNDVAGKTGTTQSNADGWFMAMTPTLVSG
ncbi:MAG: transglycosylase domain-containing protein, partial [Cyclobacteriaceae bacterium]|nr:transglycosylase domain-containing protein [Cyclobacteriaceae bacterium]